MRFRGLARYIVRLVFPIALAAAQGQALAQDIRISHQWAAVTDARDRAAHLFAQEAQARAPELKFHVHANSSLGIKPRDLLGALQAEQIEMAVFPLVLAAPKVPEFSVAGLPALVPNAAAARALKGSEIYDMLQSIAEENGVRILALLWNPGGFLAKGREVSGPKSAQGLRIRVSDHLFGLMLEGAHASVAAMPSNEIYDAMKGGSLDAVVTTYETMLSRKLYEQAKFATVGNPSLFMGFSPLVMSMATWRRLTPGQQAAVEEAAALTDSHYEQVQRDVERRLVTTLRGAGVQVRQMTPEEYLAWLQLAQRTAWIEYLKINPRSRDMLMALVRNFLESVDGAK
jgi:TRAP-type C4-dicarboxylate transport system substrate-binding protein